MKNEFAIPENQRRELAHGLAKILADTYTLYLKTHNFHWNVTGPMFPSLHTMFETQYTELASAVDEIAERIRALGVYAPGSYKEYSELTSISEQAGKVNWKEMVDQLGSDHASIADTIRSQFKSVEAASDQATADLLTRRLDVHEKTTWMLRALREE